MLVRGASSLARDLGVSPLAVGLTVVAFGTSAPELAVNLAAAWRGDAAISFGNVVGSNIANVGVILALSALVRPLAVQGVVVAREVPMLLVASAAAMVLGLDRIRGAPESYDRADGLVLLLLFGVFLFYTVAEVVRGRSADPLVSEAEERRGTPGLRSAARSVLGAGVGLALLVGGAEATVRKAVALAALLGVPEVIVGLTVVAVGTSLPELATSAVAARRGQVDLAVGNVVGSNLFNLLFILGVTAFVRPVAVPAAGAADLLAMGAFAAVLLPLGLRRRGRVGRVEALALLAAYVGYTAWRVATG